MRLDEVFRPINESRKKVSSETLAEYINTYCKPYMSANPQYETLPLCRGMRNEGDSPFITDVRTNRPPKDSNVHIQTGIDGALKQKGFTTLRSNSIFCTGDEDEAGNYGDVYHVFPIGNFSFLWSPKIYDLLNHSNLIYRTMGLTDNDGTPFTSMDRDVNSAQATASGGINGDFDKVVDNLEYQDTDLVSAIQSNNEIMIHCQRVLYVPWSIDPEY